jgi:hypothetical protein
VVPALIALLGIANPSVSAHKSALLGKELALLSATGLDVSNPDVRNQVAEIIPICSARRNYEIFSLTTVSYAVTLPAPIHLHNRILGVGAGLCLPVGRAVMPSIRG